MENRRKRSEHLSYVMLALLFVMFCLVLAALVYGDIKSDYGALVGGFGTTILGMFAVAVGFLWGSSKGSQLKDEVMAGSPPPASTGDQNAEVINNNVTDGKPTGSV